MISYFWKKIIISIFYLLITPLSFKALSFRFEKVSKFLRFFYYCELKVYIYCNLMPIKFLKYLFTSVLDPTTIQRRIVWRMCWWSRWLTCSQPCTDVPSYSASLASRQCICLQTAWKSKFVFAWKSTKDATTYNKTQCKFIIWYTFKVSWKPKF